MGEKEIDAFLEQLLDELLEKLRVASDAPEDTRARISKAFAAAGFKNADVPVAVVQLRRSLLNESDRGCALAGAAFLESALGALLRTYLLDDPKVADELFAGTGPLATFSARIDLAYALGLVGAHGRRDMHLIRKVRNEFAHEPGTPSFDDAPIAARCRELHADVWDEGLSSRKRFVRALLGSVGRIHGRMQLTTHRDAAPDADLKDPKMQEQLGRMREAMLRARNRQTIRRGAMTLAKWRRLTLVSRPAVGPAAELPTASPA
jgi:hypothetical protein